jgi:hypothetical protein
MERMPSNAIIKSFFALLVNVTKAQLKQIDVYTITMKFVTSAQISGMHSLTAANGSRF